jgi:hypothetical protein
LGELAIFQKDKPRAEANLKQAIQLDPKGPYGALARRMLEFGAAVQYKETV